MVDEGTEDGAYLYYGGFSLNGAVYDSSNADATFPDIKYGVKNIGDHNGDGYDDLLIGGECNHSLCSGYTSPVFLFHGAPN